MLIQKERSTTCGLQRFAVSDQHVDDWNQSQIINMFQIINDIFLKSW